MGAHEIRIRLGGVSRQRAYQITSRADFPKPVADLAQGKVWTTEDVEAWMQVHRRDLDEDRPAAIRRPAGGVAGGWVDAALIAVRVAHSRGRGAARDRPVPAPTVV